MKSFSVVIVCRDEADVIGTALESVAGLTDDVIVYDTGSVDGTIEKAGQFGVRLFQGPWEGYGKTKNRAIQLARYDWILSLDADEAADPTLRDALLACEPASDADAFDIRRRNYYGARYLRFGHWGRDHLVRFFNRQTLRWNADAVHEKLEYAPGTKIRRMPGFILHRSIRDLSDYSGKMVRYALLGAEKYYAQGRRAGWLRVCVSPCFAFFVNYFLKLGFLDGYAGYLTAKMTAWYTFLKYARLRELSAKS
ncbi:MAG TPA: glycosyltransferase family 2 protein [Chitinophagaceae bacterium]|nr:glycosyltransferase family 2 protein [Chitinophagaceae bacterium]